MSDVKYHRRVITITAEDSPNVKYARAQERLGLPITDTIVIPDSNLLTWGEYQHRLATWDKVRQTIGLKAQFYEGAELLLFPPDWLDAAVQAALSRPSPTYPRWLGVDPAEGGDRSSWAVVDVWGLIELVSLRTPDTNVIPAETERLIVKHSIEDVNVVFDRGGGGKQHADRMRANGRKHIRTVGFGEQVSLDPKRGMQLVETRIDTKEDKSAYANRRAEMYCELSDLVGGRSVGDLIRNAPFALPQEMLEHVFDLQRQCLRNQLAPIPKLYDRDGKLKLLPKQNPTDADDSRTLVALIGHSPDEADALALATHGMLHKKRVMRAGAA